MKSMKASVTGALGALFGTAVGLALAAGQAAQPPAPPATGPAPTVLDPCTLGAANKIRDAVNAGIGAAFPITMAQGADEVTLSNPVVRDVTCPKMAVTMVADVRLRRTQGLKISTRGRIQFTTPVEARVTMGGGGLLDIAKAELCLTNIQVTRLNLKGVPNWLDNSDRVREGLVAKIGAQKCVDISGIVRKHLQKGGTLR